MKSTVHTRSERESPTAAAMDVSDVLQRLGDDEELLRDIVQIYLEDVPGMLERIHSAVSGGDANSLRRAAHSLKGLAATLSAQEVVGVASRLEHMGAARNLAEASQIVTEVDQRVSELTQSVQEFLRHK
jgi:HPt (histidine-containing phosphotransfer) domain-containing protein